jgi:RNA polymerase sigma factor (sigma-70 family)
LIALDEALKKLEQFDPRKAEIVELRYFGSQSVEDTARILGISEATIKRDWTLARAWLLREVSGSE